jgi:TolB-like protein/DNA-binding winged helix-turn-helix (wHTH) protein/rhodanese-related sulfurtransferase
VHTIAFGRFVLDTKRRILLADGEPVRLQSRSYEILEFLVSAGGRVVTKEDLVRHVWHGQAVAENNLSVQMSTLRRSLSEIGAGDLIVTLKGRGYQFLGEIVQTGLPEQGGPAGKADSAGFDSSLVAPSERDEHTPILLKLGWRGRRWIYAGGAAALLLLALAAGYVSRKPATIAGPPRLSIAVLPFRNLSDDRARDYLADAISDDVTTDLANLPGSVVIARESADSYRGRAVPAQEIGRALNVRYLLEGSLRVEDNELHINAQLIEAATGGHLWAERFETPLTHINDARDSIVRHIASALNVQLSAIEGERSLRDHPNNPDALDYFLRARFTYDQRDDLAGINEAQKLYEQAITLSPDFVDALVAESQLLISKASDYADPSYQQDLDRAAELVARALRLAPNNAKVLGVKGYLQRVSGDIAAARASYEAALAADPNFTRAQTGLAVCEWQLGHYDAQIEHLRIAMRQDPIGAAANWRSVSVGMSYFMLGHYDEAIDWLNRSLTNVAPGGSAEFGRVEWSTLFLIASYQAAGQHALAQRTFQTYAQRWHGRSVWRILSYFTAAQALTPGYARLGEALVAAGMPRFADEHHDDGAAPTTEIEENGEFAPTPTTLPGGTAVDVAGARELLATNPGAVVLDVGRGAAVMPGASWEPSPLARDTVAVQRLIDRAGRQPAFRVVPILVVGTGAYGRDGYNTCLRLIAAGLRHVAWLRGGEEAWAQAGLPSTDRRVP